MDKFSPGSVSNLPKRHKKALFTVLIITLTLAIPTATSAIINEGTIENVENTKKAEQLSYESKENAADGIRNMQDMLAVKVYATGSKQLACGCDGIVWRREEQQLGFCKEGF